MESGSKVPRGQMGKGLGTQASFDRQSSEFEEPEPLWLNKEQSSAICLKYYNPDKLQTLVCGY